MGSSLGIVHRELTGIESIGIDEIQHRRGHHYLTLVYQLDQGCKRLLCVRRERTEANNSSLQSVNSLRFNVLGVVTRGLVGFAVGG